MTENKQVEAMEVPKHEKEKIVANARKQLKTRSKGELINIIINLSAKIDELKAEKKCLKN